MDFVKNGPYSKPCIHINVQPQLLLGLTIANKTLSNLDNPFPQCIFLSGKQGWCWLGLAIPHKDSLLASYGKGSSYYGVTGRLASNDEIYLIEALNGLFRGEKQLPRSSNPIGFRDRILKFVLGTGLFFEDDTIDLSNGEIVKSGKFSTIVKPEEIYSAISDNFIAELEIAVDSDNCRFPPAHMKDSIKKDRRKGIPTGIKLTNNYIVHKYYRCEGLLNYPPKELINKSETGFDSKLNFQNTLRLHLIEIAKELEQHTPGRFDLVVSTTSPTHWYVHQIADGLTDSVHKCSHFVASRRQLFREEFPGKDFPMNSKVLIFTDVISRGSLVSSMIDTISEHHFNVTGLIALVDTRTEEEFQSDISNASFSPLREEDIRILTRRRPVEKDFSGYAKWEIDPETLEPTLIKNSQQKKDFTGKGILAVFGEIVEDWLTKYSGIDYGHFKHGNRHSKYLCNVIKLFSTQEIQMVVKTRLTWYLREFNIDTVIYPNHSNAYMLIDMLKETFPSDSTIRFHEALCRVSDGERCYVLPEISYSKDQKSSPKNVLILDDGTGSGATLRSLIVSLTRHFPKTNRIHLIVFVSEASQPNNSFWSSLAEATSIRNIEPKIRFSSFISFPLPWYTEAECPICRKKLYFEKLTLNTTLSPQERSFYEECIASLASTDNYHASSSENPSSLNADNIIKLAKYDLDLKEGLSLSELYSKLDETHDGVILHQLLLLYQASPSYEEVFSTICSIISNQKTDLEDRYLLLRELVIIGSPITKSAFWSLVEACSIYVNDPFVYGCIIALARLASPSGQGLPLWTREEVKNNMNRIMDKLPGEDVKIEFKNLTKTMLGFEEQQLASALVCLKQSILSSDHPDRTSDTISKFLSSLDDLKEGRYTYNDTTFYSMLRIRALNAKDFFHKIVHAAEILMIDEPSLQNQVSDNTFQNEKRIIENISSVANRLIRVAEKEGHVKQISKEIIDQIVGLKYRWLTINSGLVYKFLEPYYQKYAEIRSQAINDAYKECCYGYGASRMEHFIDESSGIDIESIELLITSNALYTIIYDIICNYYKYCIPYLPDVKPLKITWKTIKEEDLFGFVLEDNAQLTDQSKKLFKKSEGGNDRGRKLVESFSGQFDARILDSKNVEYKVLLLGRKKI